MEGLDFEEIDHGLIVEQARPVSLRTKVNRIIESLRRNEAIPSHDKQNYIQMLEQLLWE